MPSGTTLSMNSSSDAQPTGCSIARVSSGLGPMWRATKRSAGSRDARAVGMSDVSLRALRKGCGTGRALCANMLLVLLAPQQLVELLRVLDPELDHPALAIGIAVDERGVGFERRVDRHHRAGEGGVQLRDRLHRLDRAEHIHPPERGAQLRQVHVDDIAQLPLRVVGDPDLYDRLVVGFLDVFVLLGVAQIGRRLRHAGIALARGLRRWRRKVTGAPNPCQANGLASGNRSDRGARPLAPGSVSRNRSWPHGRTSRRTATGSGSSLNNTSTPGRPARSHARSVAAAAAAVATIASGRAATRASAFSTALPPATRRTARPASE